MRCPKCGYISFDHNTVCPKCNKDIAGEQGKMNLPLFKSKPPFLLGILVGTANDSNVGLEIGSTFKEDILGHEMDIKSDEPSALLESDEEVLDEVQDLVIGRWLLVTG